MSERPPRDVTRTGANGTSPKISRRTAGRWRSAGHEWSPRRVNLTAVRPGLRVGKRELLVFVEQGGVEIAKSTRARIRHRAQPELTQAHSGAPSEGRVRPCPKGPIASSSSLGISLSFMTD